MFGRARMAQAVAEAESAASGGSDVLNEVVVADGGKGPASKNDKKTGDEEEAESEALPDDFEYSEGLTQAEADKLLEKYGKNELPEIVTPSWLVFLLQMRAPMPIMIWIAIIVELGIQDWIDAAILLLVQLTNATIGWYETMKSGHAVAALKAGLKPEATVKRDGKFTTLDASLLVPGDCVMLGSGSAVPADCVVNGGNIEVDQAALTGESLPVKMSAGDQPKMGSTVVRGEVEATVRFTGLHTFFGKTAHLLNTKKGMNHLQKTLLKIIIVLTVVSITLCLTCFVYLIVKFKNFKDAIEFAVIVLVASIPLAMEIVVTTTLALGSRQLAEDGAIVTRLAAIEDLAGMNILCSDKTGTLTLNKMVIQDCPTYQKGLSRDQALVLAALAAKWREPPRDALDTLVLGAANLDDCDRYKQRSFTPFDPSTKYTGATIEAPDGSVFRVIKGAPNVILDMCKADTDSLRQAVDKSVTAFGARGIRALAVARSNDDSDAYSIAALLTFLDPPRHDTKDTIAQAYAYGCDVKMITGDHLLIARETCRQLGMGDQVADPKKLPSFQVGGAIPKDLGEKYGETCFRSDGFAQVYPEHKFLIVESLRQLGYGIGMTGDGVNDAPALKQADVGIAVDGATDAARAAADILLTKPGLSTIIVGLKVARTIFQRMQNFLTYRIAATLQLVFFFFIALFALEPSKYQADWPEYFFLPVILLMLITLLNDGTMIAIGYDNAAAPETPAKWNLPALFLVSCVMASVTCFSSLLLLYFALDSHSSSGLFHALTLPAMPYGKIVTLMYLNVAVSDFLGLFSARTGDRPFWTSLPARILLIGSIISLVVTTTLACVWPTGTLNSRAIQGLVYDNYDNYKLWPLWCWLYCIFWFLVQDALKLATFAILKKTDLFNYMSSKMVATRDDHTFDARGASLAAGAIESKALDAAIGQSQSAIDELARRSTAPSAALARMSVAASQARTSFAAPSRHGTLGHTSLISVTEGTDIDRFSAVSRTYAQMSEGADTLNPEERSAMEPYLANVSSAMDRLSRVSQAVEAHRRRSQQLRQRSRAHSKRASAEYGRV